MLPLADEGDRDRVAALVEADLIGQPVDQEETATTRVLQAGRVARVGQGAVVEPRSLVGHLQGHRPCVDTGSYPDLLLALTGVPVENRVGEHLTDHDAQVDQRPRPVTAIVAATASEQLDHMLDHRNIAGQLEVELVRHVAIQLARPGPGRPLDRGQLRA